MGGEGAGQRLGPPATFWLPKDGNSPDEYEDAFRVACPESIGAGEPDAARAVVTDGASESAFAREWANALAEAFEADPPELRGLTEDSLDEWLAPARERWRGCVPWDRLPWHGEAKARAGAFATLLGLTIAADAEAEGPPRLLWRAVAVGDSCLFVVREGHLSLSFPLEEDADFDNAPDLVCSNPDGVGHAWEAVRLGRGRCETGDLFILASDALACWFLAAAAAGDRPWESLAALEPGGWDAWVGEQRGAGLMRNDDTTLVMIEVV